MLGGPAGGAIALGRDADASGAIGTRVAEAASSAIAVALQAVHVAAEAAAGLLHEGTAASIALAGRLEGAEAGGAHRRAADELLRRVGAGASSRAVAGAGAGRAIRRARRACAPRGTGNGDAAPDALREVTGFALSTAGRRTADPIRADPARAFASTAAGLTDAAEGAADPGRAVLTRSAGVVQGALGVGAERPRTLAARAEHGGCVRAKACAITKSLKRRASVHATCRDAFGAQAWICAAQAVLTVTASVADPTAHEAGLPARPRRTDDRDAGAHCPGLAASLALSTAVLVATDAVDASIALAL
jgi:hypothetical protein